MQAIFQGQTGTIHLVFLLFGHNNPFTVECRTNIVCITKPNAKHYDQNKIWSLALWIIIILWLICSEQNSFANRLVHIVMSIVLKALIHSSPLWQRPPSLYVPECSHSHTFHLFTPYLCDSVSQSLCTRLVTPMCDPHIHPSPLRQRPPVSMYPSVHTHTHSTYSPLSSATVSPSLYVPDWSHPRTIHIFTPHLCDSISQSPGARQLPVHLVTRWVEGQLQVGHIHKLSARLVRRVTEVFDLCHWELSIFSRQKINREITSNIY